MSDHSDHCEQKHKHFSVSLFIIIIISSVSGYFVLLALVAPSVWERQFTASFTSHLITFLACHFCYGIFEHPFHRYVLHSPLIPGLYSFYVSHSHIHHERTDILWRKTGVENHYPILEERQHEASFFPWYTYSAFVAILTLLVFTPIYLLVRWHLYCLSHSMRFGTQFSISLMRGGYPSCIIPIL
jgi:hemolysin III